jgi:hypothetical protein
VKVAICVPTRNPQPEFCYSLAQLMAHTAAIFERHGGGHELGLLMQEGTYLPKNREELAGLALDADVTHILWLDDDMQFPKDALLRLMGREVEVVGANYVARGVPPVPVAIKCTGREADGPERARCWTGPDSTGLEVVDAIGFGCTLMQRAAFARVRERPYFENTYGRLQHGWVGEDVDFCIKFRRGGGVVHVDHDLSKEVGHVGKMVYKHEHANALLKAGLAA